MRIEDGESTAGLGVRGLVGEPAAETIERVGPIKYIPRIVAGRPLHRLANARKEQRRSTGHDVPAIGRGCGHDHRAGTGNG